MKLTEKDKQNIALGVFGKISNIFLLNGLAFVNQPKKVQSAVVMVYQQGLKDAIERTETI